MRSTHHRRMGNFSSPPEACRSRMTSSSPFFHGDGFFFSCAPFINGSFPDTSADFPHYFCPSLALSFLPLVARFRNCRAESPSLANLRVMPDPSAHVRRWRLVPCHPPASAHVFSPERSAEFSGLMFFHRFPSVGTVTIQKKPFAQ